VRTRLLSTLLIALLKCAVAPPPSVTPVVQHESARSAVAALRSSTAAVVLEWDVPGPDNRKQARKALGGAAVAIEPNTVITAAHVLNVEGGTVTGIGVMRDDQFSGPPVFSNAKRATVLWKSDEDDLAILHVDNLEAKPVHVSRNADIAPGDEVFFIGHPFEGGASVGFGYISWIGIAQLRPGMREIRLLRIDGPVNHGNSGGGLFLRGTNALIGIVTAKAGDLSSKLNQILEQRTDDVDSKSGVFFDNVNVMGVIRRAIGELKFNLQLGVGYAIPADYIPASP
jgi:S1-C subfamily serine protease